MKYASLLLVAASFVARADSAVPEYEVHLRGLFDLTEWRGALLEVKHWLPRSNRPPVYFPSMTRLAKPGEKLEDRTMKGAHINFEILEILTDGERVKLRENGKVSVYGFEDIDTAAPPIKLGIELQGVRFEDAVDLYSDLKRRTVLVHPKIIWSPVSVRAAARNEIEMIAALEKVFLEKGISIVADGGRFVLMVPISMEKTVSPRSMETDAASPQFSSTLLNSPISVTIENYGRILEREQVGGDPIPKSLVSLRTRILSKAEMLYAYDTVLGWNGLKVVVIDDKTFKVVRLPDANAP